MQERERAGRLESAGFNILNLDPADVEVDLVSDVPHYSPLARPAASPEALREPALDAALTSLYGPSRYVSFIKGRSAEYALVGAFAENKKPTVLTHGLFRSTERQLSRYDARIEVVPRRAEDEGTSHLDLDWLAKRMAAGGVDIVYLEPSNNGLGGWPLQLDHLLAIRRECTRHGALLLLDATRLLSNCATFCTDGAELVSLAQQFTDAADGFSVSCAKELLVPAGAMVAVRDLDRQRRVYFQGLINGTLLEPLEARIDLARGIDHTVRHPEDLMTRKRQLQTLLAQLKALGVPCLDPAGGHAVFVIVDAWVTSSLQARALEALLYLVGGVRAQISGYSLMKKQLLRLTLPLRTYGAAELARVPEAIRSWIDRIGEAPRLEDVPGDYVHEFFARYRPAGSSTTTAGGTASA